MSYRTIPIVVLPMNPRVYQRVAPVLVAPQTLLNPTKKEVVVDTALGSAWVNRTPQQVSRTVVDGITPGNIGHTVRIEHDSSPVLIVVIVTPPPCGLNGIMQVENKWQSTSPAVVGNTHKLDAVIDGKLTDDLDSVSIFRKVIVHKLSDGSINDLYLRCRMNFAADVFQTQAPQFMNLGLLTINTLDESGFLVPPATRIRRPTNGSHWSDLDLIFGEATAVGMSAAKSYHDYNYKTDFVIWSVNQEFERQNNFGDSTTFGLNSCGH